MWPNRIDWQQLRFGVEIEFVGGAPEAVELLPGWTMALDEHQVNDGGDRSGSELKPGPITWADRAQIRTMLERLKAMGCEANWSCGLHVHVDLSPWGEAILLPLMDAALTWQEAFCDLLQTAPHRRLYCPPVTPAMRERLAASPSREAVRRWGDPESNRCGINLGAWWDIGTVELRFANGSLEFAEICRTVELYLRFVTAVGAGQLPGVAASTITGSATAVSAGPMPYTSGETLAEALGAPPDGYPPTKPCPPWRWAQIHLLAHLRPVLEPLVASRYPEGQILSITPVAAGLEVTVELETESHDLHLPLIVLPTPTGWQVAE